MIDYIAISGSMEDRYIEYVDHLHEHFVDPVQVTAGRYVAPRSPGAGTQMTSSAIAEFRHVGR